MVTFSNSNYPTYNAQRSYTQFTAVHLAQSKQKRELTNKLQQQQKPIKKRNRQAKKLTPKIGKRKQKPNAR